MRIWRLLRSQTKLGIELGSIETTAKALKAKYNFDVIVTLGKEGALIVADNNCVKVNGYTVNAIDTVGAGDTFIGNFASNISRGVAITDAVELANAAAALSVTRVGGAAATPTVKELEEFRFTTASK